MPFLLLTVVLWLFHRSTQDQDLLAPVWFALMSFCQSIYYWRDKRAAIKGYTRTPEAQLHLINLAGGWPGALLGAVVFRHKTTKLRYQRVLKACILCNLSVCALLEYLCHR